LKLEQEKEFKMEEINHLKNKIINISKEFDDFKLSLTNVSYFQQKESDNLKVIDILKKDID